MKNVHSPFRTLSHRWERRESVWIEESFLAQPSLAQTTDLDSELLAHTHMQIIRSDRSNEVELGGGNSIRLNEEQFETYRELWFFQFW